MQTVILWRSIPITTAMLRRLFLGIYQFGLKLANIGVYEGMSFHEKTKTQVINICICAGIFPKTLFGVQNFIHGRVLLSIIILILLLGGISILIIHSYRKYLLARLILIFVSSGFLTLSAVLYRNGGEYYLLASFVMIVIFFSEKKYLIGISILNFLLFVGVKIFLETDIVFDTVPFSRIMFNVTWSVLMMMLMLWFFKTEQLTYMKQIVEKNSELEKANQTKEKIFSIIAHDLRSPIGQLKGSLELVNREYISPEQFHEIAGKLSQQVDQLHNTLDNLLRWSISQLQGITAHPEKTELSSIMEKLKIFGQKLEEKKIELRLEDIDQKLWVDPDHLLLVLRNLLSNAIKYSYPGGTISIHCQANGENVTIAISDTGTGMSKQVRDSVFHSINIISQMGTANEKGTGLGLKLCREFIEKNNGAIFVESSENKGSTFYVSLPQAN
jgi:two-component system sensor histidine kinase/response regulator